MNIPDKAVEAACNVYGIMAQTPQGGQTPGAGVAS